MIAYLFALMLPASAFFGGAYLIFRGVSKGNPSAARLSSGQARADSAFRSPISGDDCIYSKLTVEYFTGKEPEWKEVYSSERRCDFRLSGRPVSAGHADFRPSRVVALQGFVPHEGGLLSGIEGILEAAGYGEKSPLGKLRSALNGESKPFIDGAAIERLSADHRLKKAIERHHKKFLRISEHSIPDGRKLHVASFGPDLAGTMEHPLLITETPQEARTALDEKAKMSVLLGSGLIAFSFLLSSLLLASMEPF